MEDGNGGTTPAQTLNEVQGCRTLSDYRICPDGNFLIAWIDRRMDGPKPRQLYLMRLIQMARR